MSQFMGVPVGQREDKRVTGTTALRKWYKHVRNVMAHAQKPDLVFQRNERVHLNQRGCQFSRLLAVEECGSADSDCIDRVLTYSARLLATDSIHIFPLHFPARASPCAIRFRTRYTFCLVLNTWMTVLKFSYPFSHGNKLSLFCGNVIWPFTGTDTVVSADTEHENQHL